MPSSKNPFAVAKEMMQKNASKNEVLENPEQSSQPDITDDNLPDTTSELTESPDTNSEIKTGNPSEEEIPESIAKLLAGPKSKKSHMVPMLLDFALKEIKDRENSAMKARGEKGTKKTEDDYVVQAMIEFFSTPGLRADCLKSAAKKLKSIL